MTGSLLRLRRLLTLSARAALSAVHYGAAPTHGG